MSNKTKAVIDLKCVNTFEELKEYATQRMTAIRDDNTTSHPVKLNQEKRLGKSLLVKITGRSTLKEENRPQLTTINRKVTMLRTHIKFDGFLRHDFSYKINILIEKFPQIQKTIEKLPNLTLKEIEKAFPYAVNKLQNRLNISKKKETKDSLRSAIAALKRISYRPAVFETLVRTTEQKKSMTNKQSERIKGYLSKQIRIDYDDIHKKINELLASKDWKKLAFGLALASGRRRAEIVCYKSANFKESNNQKELLFTTRVKTKEPLTYKIPVLVDATLFLDRLNQLRASPRITKLMIDAKVEEVDNYDIYHSKISSSISNPINKFVDSFMNADLTPKKKRRWSFKDSRAIYARIAYAEYSAMTHKAGREPIADDLFFFKKLGHTDTGTQQNYKRYILKGEPTYSAVNKIKKESVEVINTEFNRVEALEQLFNKKKYKTVAFDKYLSFVLGAIKKDSAIKITSTYIKTELGGCKETICKFVKIIKDADLQKAK